jgi:hypothetical protein
MIEYDALLVHCRFYEFTVPCKIEIRLPPSFRKACAMKHSCSVQYATLRTVCAPKSHKILESISLRSKLFIRTTMSGPLVLVFHL